jgi:hypothetical protein
MGESELASPGTAPSRRLHLGNGWASRPQSDAPGADALKKAGKKQSMTGFTAQEVTADPTSWLNKKEQEPKKDPSNQLNLGPPHSRDLLVPRTGKVVLKTPCKGCWTPGGRRAGPRIAT